MTTTDTKGNNSPAWIQDRSFTMPLHVTKAAEKASVPVIGLVHDVKDYDGKSDEAFYAADWIRKQLVAYFDNTKTPRRVKIRARSRGCFEIIVQKPVGEKAKEAA